MHAIFQMYAVVLAAIFGDAANKAGEKAAEVAEPGFFQDLRAAWRALKAIYHAVGSMIGVLKQVSLWWKHILLDYVVRWPHYGDNYAMWAAYVVGWVCWYLVIRQSIEPLEKRAHKEHTKIATFGEYLVDPRKVPGLEQLFKIPGLGSIAGTVFIVIYVVTCWPVMLLGFSLQKLELMVFLLCFGGANFCAMYDGWGFWLGPVALVLRTVLVDQSEREKAIRLIRAKGVIDGTWAIFAGQLKVPGLGWKCTIETCGARNPNEYEVCRKCRHPNVMKDWFHCGYEWSYDQTFCAVCNGDKPEPPAKHKASRQAKPKAEKKAHGGGHGHDDHGHGGHGDDHGHGGGDHGHGDHGAGHGEHGGHHDTHATTDTAHATTTVACPHCHEQTDAHDPFCGECGQPLKGRKRRI